MQRFNRAVVVAVLLAGSAAMALPGAALPAAAQAGCAQPPEPVDPIPEVPWAQEWFTPDRIWALSRGSGVLVAVVDTGVDARHRQLRDGQVRTGRDFLPEPAGARVDCHGHGTAVASIVAGAPVDGVGFAGLAPDAQILPVRVAERSTGETGPERQPEVDPDRFARAVRWAADQGAQVINVSVVFYRDHPAIAGAVAHAVDRGAVVVAAAGPAPDEASGPGLTPYPAGYPGVLGVGAIDPDGTTTSWSGPPVDLLAPGDGVVAAATVGHQRWSGSSFAAPFVSAAAALVLAADPELPAGEVVRRLLATADPGSGPGRSPSPVVNPYRALTERLVDGEPVPAAEPLGDVAVDPVAQARADRWERAGRLAATVALSAAVGFLLLVGGGAVWRRGRRRGWRPVHATRAPTRAPEPAPAAPGSGTDDPQRRFFTVPTPRTRR